MRIATKGLSRLAFGFLLATGIAQSAWAVEPVPQRPVDTAGLGAKQVFHDCADCPQMVVVAAGTYTMGARATEPAYFSIEGPRHKVSVKRFALGQFDVTRGQFATFVAATRRHIPAGCEWSLTEAGTPEVGWNHLGFPQDDTHPVVCVSLQDANDYAAWLRDQTGRAYRLPTEAEWEYAARAGTTTTFPWGDQANHEQANYGADKCCGPLTQGRDAWDFTSPVGSFPANAFGLFDMQGNVLQMVQDCFSISYEGLPTDGSANLKSVPIKASGELTEIGFDGGESCDYHIVRGGDWGDPPGQIRPGFRNFAPPPGDKALPYRSGGLGFRVAASLP
jgi:formylglycine-generating enzyme required for sulfatase activity